MISFRPLIGTGPSPFFGGKDQTPCESRGALGSRPTRSSYISSQGCARHPPMHQALLQDACQCPYLNTRPADARTFSGTAGFTGFVGLLLISWRVAGGLVKTPNVFLPLLVSHQQNNKLTSLSFFSFPQSFLLQELCGAINAKIS